MPFALIFAIFLLFTDIHRIDDGWKGSSTVYPFVPGHEIVGEVVARGSDVKLELGATVGVGPIAGACFQTDCVYCSKAQENYCPKVRQARHLLPWLTPIFFHSHPQRYFTYSSVDPTGRPTYGGYADAVVADERFVFLIPSALKAEQAAPLLCAGITTFAPFVENNVTKKDVSRATEAPF